MELIFIMMWNKGSSCGINLILVELCGIISTNSVSHKVWKPVVGCGLKLSDVELCGIEFCVIVEFKFT